MDNLVKLDPDDEKEEKPVIDEENEEPVEYQRMSCLFCGYSKSKRLSDLGLPSLQGCQGNASVNHQLWSVFILRKLAQYPTEEIARGLKDKDGIPVSNWLMLCESCNQMVKDAMLGFHEILMLEAKIKSFQHQVKQKIEKSSKVQTHMNSTFNIVEEIRKRFEQVTLPPEPQNSEHSDLDDALGSDDLDQDEYETSVLSPPQFINKSTDFEMTCEICVPSRLYTNSSSYERHQKAHDVTQHPCLKCNFPCSSASALKMHSSKPCKLTNRKYKGTRSGKPKPSLICKICLVQRIFTYKSYDAHMRKHRDLKYSCPKCRYPFPSSILMERHVSKKMCERRRKRKDEIFSCHICPFKTTTQTTLDSHVNNHELYDCKEVNGKFNCKYCQKDFPSSLSLKRHIREDHHEDHGAPIYKCPTCSKIFCKSNTLKFHIAEKHEKQCRFYCEICGYGTMRKFVLDKHRTTHANERLFICDLCAASFKTRTSFNTHMKRVHAPSRSTVEHICKYCSDNDGNTFLNKSLLDRHLKDKHKDLYVYNCDKCDNSYLSGASLQLHKKINHSGEKAECQFCGCEVLNRVYLYSHYKICQKKPPDFKYKYPRS